MVARAERIGHSLQMSIILKRERNLRVFSRGQGAIAPRQRGQMREGTLKSTTRKYFLVRSPVLLVTVCQRETRVKQDPMKWEPGYSLGKSLKWFMGGWARFLKIFSPYPQTSLLFRT